ncbi:hypothetical protein ACO2Q9_04995 [Variovorax sp. VNK109]|uniref:hypothetical protein n=1 Tax=Variovorax sp. VNK109 TaxID=3400919 RepID=UPI003C03EB27
MNTSAVPRRTFIGWAVWSFVVAPTAASASIHTLGHTDSSALQQGDQLFASRVPEKAKQVHAKFASGVYVSIYEVTTEESRHGVSTERWLCMAFKTESGEYVVQTSGDALFTSTNWHPTEIAGVTVLDGGDVEVVEELLRGNSTTRWSRSGNTWELAAMRSAGVSGHRIYEEEYDRDTRELVVRSGDPGETDDLLETKRYAVTEAFTLADYGRKSLVDVA